jgi:hypothetical protein
MIGFYALGNALVWGFGFLPEDDVAGSVLWGGTLAQPGLLAVWAALGRQPVGSRVPKAVSLLALMGLSVSAGVASSEYTGAESGDVIVIASTTFVLASVALAVIRWWFGWQVGIGAPQSIPSPIGRAQFTIRDLLGCTAAAALALGLGVWVAPDLRGDFLEILEMALTIGVPCALLVVPCVGYALGRRRRVLFLVWMALTCAAIPCAFASLIWDYAAAAFVIAASISLALCACTCTSLLVLRRCGLRLLNRRKDGPNPPLPPAG